MTLKPLSDKCKDGKCTHKKCDCGHCKNYHLGEWECLQISPLLRTCSCRQFYDVVLHWRGECHSCGFIRNCTSYKTVFLCARCKKEAEIDAKEVIQTGL